MPISPLFTHILARRPWLEQEGLTRHGFTSIPAERPAPDPSLGARLIDAYERAHQRRPADYQPNDVWQKFIETHYGGMLALIRERDAGGLLDYLTALPRQGGGHGYFQGEATYRALLESPELQRTRALWMLDHLTGLAEALGVIRERCPEQGDWTNPPFSSVAELCGQLRQVLGLPLGVPPIFDGLHALEPETERCHLRSIMAAYAVHQLRAFFRGFQGREPPALRVAEIGAGIGLTAYLASVAGFARYSVYDLPEVNVAQGFLLLIMLGPDKVRLYGEAPGAAIEVMPAWEFEGVAGKAFDAVLNIDSFPEIDKALTRRYLRTTASAADWFFSINQEAPRNDPCGGRREPVRGLVAEMPGYASVSRSRNWVRAGYVDEVFRTGGHDAGGRR